MPLQSDTSITKNPSVDAHPTAGWQGGSLGGLRLTRVHGILWRGYGGGRPSAAEKEQFDQMRKDLGSAQT